MHLVKHLVKKQASKVFPLDNFPHYHITFEPHSTSVVIFERIESKITI